MMAVQDEKLLSYVQNYQIHLIEPARIDSADLEKFSTSLREVLGYIKYSKDKKGLSEFLDDNPRMVVEANAARVIKAVTKTPIKIPEGVEVVDVCKAVEEMMNEREAIGKEEGRAEGRTEGRREGTLATLTGLVKDGILTIKDAALRANMSESAFKAEMERCQRV